MDEWFEFTPERDDFSPTAIDCSRFIEKPAGRHGFLQVQGERFVFEDGTPARFYGSQIGWIEDRDEVAYVARRLRKQGINIVRRHGNIGVSDPDGDSVLDYSEERWDVLDYMIHRFGEEGVYFILDVDYYLPVKPGEIDGLPEGGRTMHLMFFNQQARRLRYQRMEDVFTHVNPYTGRRYCEDPLIAMVEIVNEDSLFWYSLDHLKEPFRGELERQFAGWLRETGGEDVGERAELMSIGCLTEDYLREHPEELDYARAQMRFLYELEQEYFTGTYRHLRDIGLRQPISGTNWRGGGFTTRIHLRPQAELDYLDRHGYWDHPRGEGNTKWRIETCTFHNLPMVKAVVVGPDVQQENNVGNLVLAKAWERIFGMPMTITEWNTCLPNQHCLEGTGLMVAYGLLQGWENPMQFGYFSTDWQDELGPGSFDMLGNPPQLLQYPATAAMWHRRDIQEAPVVAEMALTIRELFEPRDSFKPLPWPAAWVGKVGFRFVEQPRESVAADISGYWDEDALTARSLTDELCWNAADGVVTVDTPRTQAVIGFLGEEAVSLGAVEADLSTPFGALYVTSLEEDAPIPTSEHLLVTAVGPARNTEMEYEKTGERSEKHDAPLWHLKDTGEAPVLLRAVIGGLRVRSEHAGDMKCWALDFNGKRKAEVPLAVNGDMIVFELTADHKTTYYEFATA